MLAEREIMNQDILKKFNIEIDSVINKVYFADSTKTIQMDYDLEFEEKYIRHLDLKLDDDLKTKDFKFYNIRGWRIIMATNKGEYCPRCGRKIDEGDGCPHKFHDVLEIGVSEYDG